jgi:hypothetical protein
MADSESEETPIYTIEIDVENPMLPAFAMQHDLRERYLHALEEIIDCLSHAGTAEEALTIAKVAVDPKLIEAWSREGRPLPWLDEIFGEDPDELTRQVLSSINRPLLNPVTS